MADMLQPMLELAIVFPGLLLAYIPVKSYLKQPPRRLLAWLLPALLALVIGGGLLCWRLQLPAAPVLAAVAVFAIAVYIASLRISLWKSGTVALSVCALFACLNSVSRALDAAFAGLED